MGQAGGLPKSVMASLLEVPQIQERWHGKQTP
jgi:hypothetical protein